MGKITQSKQSITSKSTTRNIKNIEIEEKIKMLKDYYVPYDMNYLYSEDFNLKRDVSIFSKQEGIKDNKKQLAIRYNLEELEEGLDKRQNIIIATSYSNVIPEGAKEILNNYVMAIQNTASQKGNDAAKCIASLENGWQITDEGYDIFSMKKTDGVKEVKRTEFTRSRNRRLIKNRYYD